jgi:hypothetical protein
LHGNISIHQLTDIELEADGSEIDFLFHFIDYEQGKESPVQMISSDDDVLNQFKNKTDKEIVFNSEYDIFSIGPFCYSNHDKNVVIDNNFVYCAKPFPMMTSEQVLVYCKDITDELYIPSVFGDISLKVGDIGIVADWNGRNEMFKHKEIIEFNSVWEPVTSTNEHNKIALNMELRDINTNEITTEPLLCFYGRRSLTDHQLSNRGSVYFYNSNLKFNSGYFRKVVSEHSGISVGMKFQAKVPGIPAFPKKNINQIMAIIVDTGIEPLVLCSNYCTLWLSDLLDSNKFTFVSFIKDTTIVDPRSIGLQDGDVFAEPSGAKFPFSVISFSGSFDFRPLTNIFSMKRHSGLYRQNITKKTLNHYKRHGILTPRTTDRIRQGMGYSSNIIPTLYGALVNINTGSCVNGFYYDEERIINV